MFKTCFFVFLFNCILFAETRNWNNNFGASLLLANSPMSPKVVNGSFAALFDNGDDWSRKLLRSEMKDSSCKYSITEIIVILMETIILFFIVISKRWEGEFEGFWCQENSFLWIRGWISSREWFQPHRKRQSCRSALQILRKKLQVMPKSKDTSIMCTLRVFIWIV